MKSLNIFFELILVKLLLVFFAQALVVCLQNGLCLLEVGLTHDLIVASQKVELIEEGRSHDFIYFMGEPILNCVVLHRQLQLGDSLAHLNLEHDV